MKFELTDAQRERYAQWRRELTASKGECYVGAVGGAYTFQFTPTGIGILVSVTRADGETIDLTDYDSM